MPHDDDPFAPAPDPELNLDLDDSFRLERKRRSSTSNLSVAVHDANVALGLDGDRRLSYAERQSGVRRGYWYMTRTPIMLILAWFTLSHLVFDAKWVFIDGANLLFHEAGHFLFKWGGDTLYFLGGTIGQLMWPFALAIYFAFKRRERFAATACAWWFGENLINIARYIHDAPVEELPLVGGNTHDWNHLFTKWDMIREARDIADTVRLVGIVMMIGTIAYLLWIIARPTKDELAAGLSAED